MPGVVEALAIGLHDVFNLFFGFNMMCEGVKLAALLAVEAFGRGSCYGLVFVNNFHLSNIKKTDL